MQPNTDRNFGLDVLRGVAIFLVMTHHLALPFRLPIGGGIVEELFGRRIVSALSWSGNWAVFLFFVLSGFLIARRCLQQFGALDRIEWRLFYWQRARRIVPLLGVLLIFISILHALEVPHFRIKGEGQSWIGAITSAVFLHLNWYEGQTSWLPAAWDVLWSLSIEEVFYLSFPWLCLWLPRRLLVIALMTLAISLPWTRAALEGNEIWQEKAYLPGFSAIACGVLAALALGRYQGSIAFHRSLAWIGLSALLMSLFFSGDFWRAWQHAALLFYCVSAAICAYGAAICWQVPNQLAHWMLGWLSRCGKLSYELYLTHMLVQIPFVAFVQSYLANQKYYWALSYPVAIALCFALAKLCEIFISKRLSLWLFQRPKKSQLLGIKST
jgi:peptidoglycan/LPS O-acetylase OafA/YrhL